MKFTKASVAALKLPAERPTTLNLTKSRPGSVFGSARAAGGPGSHRCGCTGKPGALRSATSRTSSWLGKDPAQARREARAEATVTIGNVVDEYVP